MLHINGLGEQRLSLKFKVWSMSFEHGFFRGPGPGFFALPLGLFLGGHDPGSDTLNTQVVNQHQINASSGTAIVPPGHGRPHLSIHLDVGHAQRLMLRFREEVKLRLPIPVVGQVPLRMSEKLCCCEGHGPMLFLSCE